MLFADLPVVERVPHQVPVIYVPLGQDATVLYPNIDFRCTNNTAGPITICTIVRAGLLTVRIYGKATGKSVQIKPQILKVIKGRSGSKGCVKKTMISRDVYAPSERSKRVFCVKTGSRN
ncbi:VanW like protein [Desulfosporosinus acididurans]|uniref:VanW like protein n=1 Tax=Desulfosporosinus acididurans TaxID=476652 RepID=A0A0J1FJW0_9FIRM|nr:VanW like protein [Desulfosporosinus acididurans]